MGYVAVHGNQILYERVPEMHAMRFANGVLILRIHRTTFEQLEQGLYIDEALAHIVQWADSDDKEHMELCLIYAEFAKAGFDASVQRLWNATTKLFARVMNALLFTDTVVLDQTLVQPMIITSIFADPSGHPGAHALYISVAPQVREWLRLSGRAASVQVTNAMCEAAALVYPQFGEKVARSSTKMTVNFETGTVGLFASTMTCACIGVVSGGGPESDQGKPLGFELSAHNLDHAWEQLIILAGVAQLWNLAREGINPVKS
ncbi:MAG: hypothetical protein NT003_01835 [Candidatus Magasanikbacteria bacterium]|nr:hypothetical protein [Candidatus Magasanikbacteria bacterium]